MNSPLPLDYAPRRWRGQSPKRFIQTVTEDEELCQEDFYPLLTEDDDELLVE